MSQRMDGHDSHASWLEDIEYRKEFGSESAKLATAAALVRARELADMTQSSLAELVGTSQAYIARLERGDANPTIGNIGRLLACMWLKPEIEPTPLELYTSSWNEREKTFSIVLRGLESPGARDTLEAEWKPPLTYVVRIREANVDGWSYGFETSLTACGFADLKPDTEYEVEVRSKNSSGESEPVLIKVRTNPTGRLAFGKPLADVAVGKKFAS